MQSLFKIKKNKILFFKVMNELGFKDDDKKLKRILETMNFNKNHYVCYTEFITAALSKQQYLIEERIFKAFKYFDIDNSGRITLNNLKLAMSRLGLKMSEEELKQMIDKVDIAKYGYISYEEFKKMMEDDTMHQHVESIDPIA